MIPRYSRPEMVRIWDPERRFKIWLEIELLACEAWEGLGRVPKGTTARIRKKARFQIARIDEIERRVRHDVIAFLENLSESIGPDARWLHLGMTSYDVVDTSFSVQLKEAAALLMKDLEDLLKVLKRRAFGHKMTPMIGRTHGMHAEPITLGLKLTGWYEEMRRNLRRLGQAREEIAVGKLSGAVGTFSDLDPRVEAHVCKKLGLRPEAAATQVISRDRHAVFFSTLAQIAASAERIATEIRHLQRTEVQEAEEFFAPGQKGSSAMPHKRNPVLSENLCGLARLVRSTVIPALENVSLWHERDISHSSVERVIGPDATILTDFMLTRLTTLLNELVVYPENMKRNLERSGGLIHSERLLLKLVESGMTRREAYELVQRHAMKSLKNGNDFRRLISSDPVIAKKLSKRDFDEVFDLKRSLRHVETIFRRVYA